MRFIRDAALLAALLNPLLVMADDDIVWNGFLNIVGGTLLDTPYDRVESPEGEVYQVRGYDDTFSFDQDSSAGLQAVKRIGEQDTVTLQMIAKGSENNYATRMKWLYLTHEFSDTLKVRAGRIGAATFYFSDFVDVGYAYHWISPPGPFYSFDPTVSGLDVIKTGLYGDYEWQIEAFAGNDKQYLAEVDADSIIDNARGTTFTLTHDGWLTLRTLAMRFNLTTQPRSFSADSAIDETFDAIKEQTGLSQAVVDGLRQSYEPVMRPIVEENLAFENERGSYLSFAARAEFSQWFVMAEAGRTLFDAYLLGDADNWYLSAGRRVDRWVWHITLAQEYTQLSGAAKRDYEYSQIPAQTVPGADVPLYLAKTITSNAALVSNNRRDHVILGVTYDASANAILKLEAVGMEEFGNESGETAGMGTNVMLRSALNVVF